MISAPRQYWLTVALGIVGLVAGYSIVVLGNASAFAASTSCPYAHQKEKCRCGNHADCMNGDCEGTCAGCAGS